MEENLLEEMTVLDVHMLCATVDGGGSEFADRRIAIEASLCPCHRFWKNMRRANLGCCFLRGYVHLILALSVLFNVIAFGITKQHCFLYLGIISALVFGLCTGYFRMRISQQFNIKLNSEGARELGCSTTKKSSISSTSSEHAFKKMPTPLPLPTFKVRKEKLGDRITGLQQLVAPFGKTDTASVLQEAIEYINFLHGQVNVLSTPTLKNQHPMHHHRNSDAGDGANKDLRSRGLCLVPIASMHEQVASMIPTDFWTPTFGEPFTSSLS